PDNEIAVFRWFNSRFYTLANAGYFPLALESEITTMHKNDTESAPLVISPKRARQVLDCSHKKIYELLKAGELDSIKIGRARRMVRGSIDAYIRRGLENARRT